MASNNVTRLLDSKNIPYQAHEFPAEKLGALEVAELLQISPDQIYKTIVITRENKGKKILAVVPGSSEVDLKLLARVLGEKKVYLSTERQAEKITQLRVGGISPLALINRGFQVVIDQSCQLHEHIYISGGQRGLDIRLSPADLINLTQAEVAIISR